MSSQPSPLSSRTIRVFVSSTFSDLKAERNALQERVFPRLQKYCRRRGWTFQAIDLRWGVSTEAALDQSTMRIRRAEIAHCQDVTPRPNFLGLVGDRYGWRPMAKIQAEQMDALIEHFEPAPLGSNVAAPGQPSSLPCTRRPTAARMHQSAIPRCNVPTHE